MRLPAVVCILAVCAVLTPKLLADDWVGQRVMLKKRTVEITTQDNSKWSLLGPLVSVLKEQNGKLWIRDDDVGKEGWADKAELVLFQEAAACYSELIARNEKDAWAWRQRGLARRRRKGE